MNLPDELVIEITADDIQNGRPKDSECCAAALAACRALGLFDGDHILQVDDRIMVFPDDDREATARYEIPAEMIDWIWDFDGGAPVDPATFTVVRA